VVHPRPKVRTRASLFYATSIRPYADCHEAAQRGNADSMLDSLDGRMKVEGRADSHWTAVQLGF